MDKDKELTAEEIIDLYPSKVNPFQKENGRVMLVSDAIICAKKYATLQVKKNLKEQSVSAQIILDEFKRSGRRFDTYDFAVYLAEHYKIFKASKEYIDNL